MANPKLDKETYEKLKATLDVIEADAMKSFDQYLLGLSTGSLALSVTFVEKIAPKPMHWTFFLLGMSWLFLSSAMIGTLLSFLFTQEVARHHRRRLKRHLDPPRYERFSRWKGRRRIRAYVAKMVGTHDTFGEAVDRLNYWSMQLFIWGIGSFLFFAGANLAAIGANNERRGQGSLGRDSEGGPRRPEVAPARLPDHPRAKD